MVTELGVESRFVDSDSPSWIPSYLVWTQLLGVLVYVLVVTVRLGYPTQYVVVKTQELRRETKRWPVCLGHAVIFYLLRPICCFFGHPGIKVYEKFLKSFTLRHNSWDTPYRNARAAQRQVLLWCRFWGVEPWVWDRQPGEYLCKNDFFTRTYAKKYTPKMGKAQIVSPVDGVCTWFHSTADMPKKLKNDSFWDLDAIGIPHSDRYEKNPSCMLYLAPNDYHCFHAPVTGKVVHCMMFPDFWSGTVKSDIWGSVNILAQHRRVVVVFEVNSPTNLSQVSTTDVNSVSEGLSPQSKRTGSSCTSGTMTGVRGQQQAYKLRKRLSAVQATSFDIVSSQEEDLDVAGRTSGSRAGGEPVLGEKRPESSGSETGGSTKGTGGAEDTLERASAGETESDVDAEAGDRARAADEQLQTPSSRLVPVQEHAASRSGTTSASGGRAAPCSNFVSTNYYSSVAPCPSHHDIPKKKYVAMVIVGGITVDSIRMDIKCQIAKSGYQSSNGKRKSLYGEENDSDWLLECGALSEKSSSASNGPRDDHDPDLLGGPQHDENGRKRDGEVAPGAPAQVASPRSEEDEGDRDARSDRDERSDDEGESSSVLSSEYYKKHKSSCHVKKGDKIGCFARGGSLVAMFFSHGVRLDPNIAETRQKFGPLDFKLHFGESLGSMLF
eukprot:g14721.t1